LATSRKVAWSIGVIEGQPETASLGPGMSALKAVLLGV